MKTETQAKRLRRGAQRGITLCTAAATVLASLMIAPAAIAAPVDLDDPKGPSAAHGQALALEGLGLDLLGAANSTSEFAGKQGGLAGLDLTVLGQDLKLGTVTLPLLKDPTDPNSNGLLEIGDASLLRGYSEAKSKAVAQASAGTLNDEGGLNLSDAPNADMNAAKLDLTALLAQLGLAGITNGIINELSLEVGALGAEVAKNDGEIDSSYELAGVKANVGAPLVGNLTTGLSGIVNTVGGLLNGLVGKGGLVDGVLGTLEKVLNINLVVVNLKSEGVRAQVNGLDTLVANVVDELLLTEIKNRSGSVNVDLANGTITLDVAALAIEGNGYTDLNQLPANTSLLNDKTITAITNGVTEALLGDGGADDNSLVGKLTAILTDHLWNSVSIDIFIDAKIRLLSLVPVADTTVQLTGTLAEFAGYDGAKLGNDNVKFDLDLLGFLPLGDLIEPIVKPLLNIIGQSLTGPLLTFVTQDVVAQLQPLVSGLVSGLLSPLLETLEPVLTEVATVTVNEQPKTGDLGAGSHTTNALAVKLLPGVLGANAVSLELGNASVKAADAVAALVASPSTVNAGEKVTLKGSGYTPGETVKIASALGATKSVTVDANGEFTAEWTVPAGTKAGAVTFTATGDTSKRSATASVTVKTSGTGANANANSAANANASASAAAAADGQATAAAQAAANPSSNTTTSATAKATASAQAAAKAAATTNASTTASSTADAAAAVSAQAAANSKSDSDTNANNTAAANSNASAAAKAAAIANASTNASANVSANASGSGAKADANVNASASAAADSNANASAKAAANADASTAASAKATAKAQAAAQSAATANASTKASTKADTSAQAAAQVAAHSKTDSDSKASATAQQSATAQAAAAVAANASSSSDASGIPQPPVTKGCDVTKPRAKSPFVDTPTNHKFYPEIDWMHCTKLSTGWKVQKGFEYRPSADMTREAMAAFIFRMQAPKNYKAPTKSLFTDVKTDHRFYREIMWMKESGTSTGYADGTYRPGSKLDRDAMAAFIFRMNAPRNYQPKTQTFVDVDKNTKFYKEIEWMGQEELSKGFWTTAGPEYRPKNGLSREAMAAFIERLVNDYWSSVIPKK